MALWIVWNDAKTQCVGFTNKQDAEEAAGIKPLRGICSSLAVQWRDMYADEWNGKQPKASDRKRFEIEKVK